MATWVLSECAIKPLPQTFYRPRNRLTPFNNTNPLKIRSSLSKNVSTDLNYPLISHPKGISNRNWVLKVSTPLRVASVDKEEENGGVKITNSVNGFVDETEFNPGAPPPFKLADIRPAIPKHCWVKDPWRSMSYVARDVAIVFGSAAAAAYLNNWLAWPLYWAAQGTMFWALFVLGHFIKIYGL